MEIYFSKEHEWIQVDANDKSLVTVGITDYAQDSLGDIVYAELPSEGDAVEEGKGIAVLESAKAASDIYAPVTGEIVSINTNLEDTPELVNQSPRDEGWLFSIKMSNTSELESLISEEEYKNFIKDL